jgi:hypothetical protein
VMTDYLLETKKHVFLTGSTNNPHSSGVGAGRKHILRYLLQEWGFRHLQRQQQLLARESPPSSPPGVTAAVISSESEEDTVVTSCCDTGAVLLGGESIYKFARVRSDDSDPHVVFRRIMARPTLATRWLQMTRLVLDDVSLLPLHVFALIEHTARLVRKSSEYFGGVQLFCSGDFFSVGPPSPFYGPGSYGYGIGLDTGRGRHRKRLYSEHEPLSEPKRAHGLSTASVGGGLASGANGDVGVSVDIELLRVGRQWCFQNQLWSGMQLDLPAVVVARPTGELLVRESPESTHGIAVNLDSLGQASLGGSATDITSAALLTSTGCDTTSGEGDEQGRTGSYADALAAVRLGEVSEHLLNVLSTCNVLFKPHPTGGLTPIQLRKCVSTAVCLCVRLVLSCLLC